MKKINIDQLRKIQLELLKDFHDFCVSNKLRYFLDAGTLLGAIRHKGYIPWDDDIDVGMSRPDYEQFIKKRATDTRIRFFFYQKIRLKHI